MNHKFEKPFSVVIAGVGGQGAITMTQLVLGAAWRSGLHTLQSEVHGMSQRGGEVNAQVIFDTEPVTSPIVEEGDADVLIGLEPLETLRYIQLMSKKAYIVSANSPIKNMQTYPNEEEIFSELKKFDVVIVDTEEHAKKLNNKHAGNMTLLGMASKHMPIQEAVWHQVITELFTPKGEKVINMNIEAFTYGRNL